MTLRVGLIGCGLISMRSHLPAIATLKSKIKLVAVSDIRCDAAKRAASLFDAGVEIDLDYRSLLDRKDIDFVLIASPESVHCEQVMAAAHAGKHVLCEKPMAVTLEEADAMIDACERNNVQLMIGHSRRWTRRYQEAARAIDDGLIGEVRLIRENERRSQQQVARSGQWTPDGQMHWASMSRYSAGFALMTSIHESDLFHFFSGQTPVKVFGESMITQPGSEVPDFISFVVEFDGGVLAGSELSNSVPPGYPCFHQLEIYGTLGALRSKDSESWTLMQFDDQSVTFPTNYETLLHYQDAYVGQLSAFVDALVSNTPAPLPASAARNALAVSLAALESSRVGQVVDLQAKIKSEVRQ